MLCYVSVCSLFVCIVVCVSVMLHLLFHLWQLLVYHHIYVGLHDLLVDEHYQHHMDQVSGKTKHMSCHVMEDVMSCHVMQHRSPSMTCMEMERGGWSNVSMSACQDVRMDGWLSR